MNFKAIAWVAVFLMVSGCAAQDEVISVREPKKLITIDDYDDLETKPRKEKVVEVDHKEEGIYRQNFKNVKINKE